MYKDKEKQKQAAKDAKARYLAKKQGIQQKQAKSEGIPEKPIIEPKISSQDAPESTMSKNTLQEYPEKRIPKNTLIPSGDVLVPGNKNIWQRLDGTRYIIDASGFKHEWSAENHQPIDGSYLPDSVVADIMRINQRCEGGDKDKLKLRIQSALQYQKVQTVDFAGVA